MDESEALERLVLTPLDADDDNDADLTGDEHMNMSIVGAVADTKRREDSGISSPPASRSSGSKRHSQELLKGVIIEACSPTKSATKPGTHTVHSSYPSSRPSFNSILSSLV